MRIDDIDFQITRKKIKSIRLGVYPPDGEVRISAPVGVSETKLWDIIRQKLPWIRQKQQDVRQRLPTEQIGYASGDKHYFLGTPCQLIVAPGKAGIELLGDKIICLTIKADACDQDKAHLLAHWYRQQLQMIIPPLIKKWELVMGLKVAEWRIRKMRTRWGTCNPAARRIWLNLDLIKYPLSCIEYVVVHEMVHFFERSHNHVFKAYMDKFLPDWRLQKSLLKNDNNN